MLEVFKVSALEGDRHGSSSDSAEDLISIIRGGGPAMDGEGAFKTLGKKGGRGGGGYGCLLRGLSFLGGGVSGVSGTCIQE
jgi:hypothetical protein